MHIPSFCTIRIAPQTAVGLCPQLASFRWYQSANVQTSSAALFNTIALPLRVYLCVLSALVSRNSSS